GRRNAGFDFATFGEPLFAATVHDANILVAVNLRLPERPRGEPVVVIAVHNDRGVRRDPGLAEEPFELFLREDVAAKLIGKLRVPRPSDGAGHMAYDEGHVPGAIAWAWN